MQKYFSGVHTFSSISSKRFIRHAYVLIERQCGLPVRELCFSAEWPEFESNQNQKKCSKWVSDLKQASLKGSKCR